ncbi:hypothetical protein AVEN_263814-1 [Araneus ventricosus]|uniref:Uncharacterized protein n=1 Tax=Araneus ventricosus TaxID=182803 RepID=A0A4Y2X251_ARAVE|nr:hypothetical protein AVEN_263814-1 [Araneus ventricosus]
MPVSTRSRKMVTSQHSTAPDAGLTAADQIENRCFRMQARYNHKPSCKGGKSYGINIQPQLSRASILSDVSIVFQRPALNVLRAPAYLAAVRMALKWSSYAMPTRKPEIIQTPAIRNDQRANKLFSESPLLIALPNIPFILKLKSVFLGEEGVLIRKKPD